MNRLYLSGPRLLRHVLDSLCDRICCGVLGMSAEILGTPENLEINSYDHDDSRKPACLFSNPGKPCLNNSRDPIILILLRGHIRKREFSKKHHDLFTKAESNNPELLVALGNLYKCSLSRSTQKCPGKNRRTRSLS